MRRAAKMCKDCPFRGLAEIERKDLARFPAENWACHTEQGYWGSCDIQCRGHWEAQRKYPLLVRSALDEDTSE
jgi:hypothetical protein